MEFRKSGACAQRRRRVLIEENLPERQGEKAAEPEGSASAKRRLQPYADAARADRLPPITAVIPRRRWTLALLAVAALAVIAGLEALYGRLSLESVRPWPAELASLDVAAPGGLAAWFSSLLLALAALEGIQIYRIRRHKTDDYRGRYRVWLWIPLALFAMAAAVATPVGRDLCSLAAALLGGQAPIDSPVSEALAGCILWTLLSVRLAFEVRESRASLAALGTATCCYFAVALMRLVPDVMPHGPVAVIAQTSTAMVGHLAAWLAVAIYGRHVYLQAQGEAPASAATRARKAAGKRKRQKRQDEETCNGQGQQRSGQRDLADGSNGERPTSLRVVGGDSPSVTESREAAEPSKAESAATAKPSKAASGAAAEFSPASVQDPLVPMRKLTKAERRRLRKQRRREQKRRLAA